MGGVVCHRLLQWCFSSSSSFFFPSPRTPSTDRDFFFAEFGLLLFVGPASSFPGDGLEDLCCWAPNSVSGFQHIPQRTPLNNVLCLSFILFSSIQCLCASSVPHFYQYTLITILKTWLHCYNISHESDSLCPYLALCTHTLVPIHIYCHIWYYSPFSWTSPFFTKCAVLIQLPLLQS